MSTHFIGVLQALDYINEGGADYQKEYKEYVLAHKDRVRRFADWLKENCPEVFEGIDFTTFDEVIEEHDESKFSEEEFEPYAQKWYGDGKETFEYEEAWKHHWMNNEHHPEYWLGEDMPYIYILEMLCDWGSFSIASGDMTELSDFYFNKAKADPEKNLSEATQEIIEDVLERINSVIAHEELSEWVDSKGNKVVTNSSVSSQAVSSSSSKPKSQVKRYSRLTQQIDTDGLCTNRRTNKFNSTTLELTLDTAKTKDLNLRIVYDPADDDYELITNGKTSLSSCDYEKDILPILIAGGVINNTDLCE